MIREERALVKQMAPESHGEKKDDLAFFDPTNGLNFQFC